jgi:uroporphyrinogen decarboxylase
MLEWSIDPKVRTANGTPDQVTEAVKKCISTASPGGGHILSSSNSIHSQVKPENFLVMLEAAQRFGKYPINMVR